MEAVSTLWIGTTCRDGGWMTAIEMTAAAGATATKRPISGAAVGLDAALGWAATRALAEAIRGGTFERLAAGRADPTELAAAVGLPVDRLLAQLAALGAQGLVQLEEDGRVQLADHAGEVARAAAMVLGGDVPAAPPRLSWPILDPTLGAWAAAALAPAGRWLVLGGDAGFVRSFGDGLDLSHLAEDAAEFGAALAGEEWPAGLDGVLILRGLGRSAKTAISAVIEAAEEALRPGGCFACLDLVLDDDYAGPRHAGLWAFAQADLGGEAPPLTLNFLGLRLAELCFAPPIAAEAPDGVHRLIWSRRD